MDAGNAVHSTWPKQHQSWITSVALSGARAVTGSYDRSVVVWDRGTGQWTHALKGHAGQARPRSRCLFFSFTSALLRSIFKS